MEVIKDVYVYLSNNWYGILMAGSMLLATAEFIVRLTPTKKDDGFVQRIANVYNKIFEFFKIPNVKKKDGSLIIPSGLHEPKKIKLSISGAEEKS